MKTFVYGDSFSHHKECKCPQDQMWYAPLVKGDLVDRTRSGQSTAETFLLAINDAVQEPASRFVLGSPLLFCRMPIYKDQLYDHEQITSGTVDDCFPFFGTHSLEKHLHVSLFHHTLVWSQYLANVLSFAHIARHHEHQFVITHMGTPASEHITRGHPLILPLLKQTTKIPEYIDQKHSCPTVCQRAGILPWDHAEYGSHGHHSREGQQHYGTYIANMIRERNLWN